jgi:hypothetical protein
MKTTLIEIKRLAKAIKLRIGFSPETDEEHDLLDAIIFLCDESLPEASETHPYETAISRLIQGPPLDCKLKYFSKGEYSTSAGIPKHQPFHEQIDWARNKGAVKFWVTFLNKEQEQTLELSWDDLNK